MTKRIVNQSGQALVETSVGIAFVVIPLLVLIPFMAKVSGLQHRANQSAHYGAWERTVWLNKSPNRMPLVQGLYTAKKTQQQVAQQIPWRLYRQDNQALSSVTNNWNWNADSHPMLRFQPGSSDDVKPLLKSWENDPKDNTELGRFRYSQIGSRVPGAVANIVNRALGVLSFTGFSLEDDQFYQTSVSTELEQLRIAPFSEIQIQPRGNSALLATGWNAAGPHHLRSRSERLVGTSLLNNGVIRTAQRIAGFLPFGKSLKPGNLKFGHVDVEQLPEVHLCTYGTRNCGG